MKNNKGFISVVMLLALTLAGVLVLFVPNNPVGNLLGVTQKPNKIVQTEKVELIKDAQGVPIAYKTTTSDKDIQQHVGIFEQLRSLPILYLILMGLGIGFPGIAVWRHKVAVGLANDYADLTGETKRIVLSVKEGLATLPDDTARSKFLTAMSTKQDQSTKDLVKELLKNGT